MGNYKPGELVVKRWSKAKNFKRKVFKIIAKLPIKSYNTKYLVVDPYGKQSEIFDYHLHGLTEAEVSLQRTIESAEHQVNRAKEQYNTFKNEIRDAASYFPNVL